MILKKVPQYLSDNYDITRGDLEDIRQILGKYPFFDVLRFLYLKTWYELEYDTFKEELSRSAIFISKRDNLFFYIFDSEFTTYYSKHKSKESDADKTLHLINAFFETKGEIETDNLELGKSEKDNLATTDYLSFLGSIEEKRPKQPKQKVKITTGLITLETIDNKQTIDIPSIPETQDIEIPNSLITVELKRKDNIPDDLSEIPLIHGDEYNVESHSELDDEHIKEQLEHSLMMLTSEIKNQQAPKPMKHQDMIDKFLENDHLHIEFDREEISKDSDDYSLDEDVAPELDEHSFFTETLAKIYTKQGRYEKAYEIIKHLSLKVPRKNVYFVEQLSYLEKLIINKKRNKK